MGKSVREFLRDESGMGTVEIISEGTHAKYSFQKNAKNPLFIGVMRFPLLICRICRICKILFTF